MHADTPEPVYGMPAISRSSCTVPSSPSRPCRATKATSGRCARRRSTRSEPTSTPTTSWPRRCRASSTRAPERIDTLRSRERPPFRTATLISPPTPFANAQRSRVGRRASAPSSGLAPRLSTWQLQHVVRLLRLVPLLRCRCPAGERAEQLDLLAHDLADAPHALADVLLADAREVQAHRRAAAPVEVRGAAGHERDVLLL